MFGESHSHLFPLSSFVDTPICMWSENMFAAHAAGTLHGHLSFLRAALLASLLINHMLQKDKSRENEEEAERAEERGDRQRERCGGGCQHVKAARLGSVRAQEGTGRASGGAS